MIPIDIIRNPEECCWQLLRVFRALGLDSALFEALGFKG